MASTAPSSPQKGKYHGPGRAADYIPRPPNAFMLFRSDFVKKGLIPSHVEAKQQTLSVLASKCWRRLDPEEQGIWVDLAEKIKREHSLQYPAFAYKPSPKRHIKPRRQSRTREQQIAAAEELMAQYLPDNADPIPRNSVSTTTQARKRRTYTKSRPPPPQSPPESVPKKCAEANIQIFSSLQDEPIFMDLLRPSSPPAAHPTPSHSPGVKQVEQPSMLTTTHEEPTAVDHPFVFYNEWQVESPPRSSNPPPQSSAEKIVPVNIVAHIRAQYDSSLRSGILPTGLFDVLEKKPMLETESFLPPLQAQERHNTIPKPSSPPMHGHISPNSVFSNGSFTQQECHQSPTSFVCDASAHSPASRYQSPISLSYPQRLHASPLPITLSPQNFPMTVEAHGDLETLPLQTPDFDPQSALPLDLGFLTHPPSNTDIINLSGNFAFDSESFPFGEAFGLLSLCGSEAASDWWMTPMGDHLQVNASPTDQ